MTIIFLGLSVASEHATSYRALIRALAQRGHAVLFLERGAPWNAARRDPPSWGVTRLYSSLGELRMRYTPHVRQADLVVLGSDVLEGTAVAEWVLDVADGMTAFWDMDTPGTLAKLEQGDGESPAPTLVSRFDAYLSGSGGPLLDRIRHELGAVRATPFYAMADANVYVPIDEDERWALGYLDGYSEDRRLRVTNLLTQPARALPHLPFVVAGPYEPTPAWPANVERIEHLPPGDHPRFFNRQRFTLDVTRGPALEAGWSPNARLFEAAACATPVISDPWNGIEEFFHPGDEILLAYSGDDVAEILEWVSPEEAREIGLAARERVLAEHTADRRATQLEDLVREPAGAGA